MGFLRRVPVALRRHFVGGPVTRPCYLSAMSSPSPIDSYIAKSPAYAQPILRHLRALVHKACPTVHETIKWGMPSFEYQGILCGMAAFKNHCTFGFWKAALMQDEVLRENARREDAMGHLGRITALSDLPSDAQILAWLREAMTLNEQGAKLPRAKKVEKPEAALPAALAEALAGDAGAQATFAAFSPSCRREYVEWIAEAKTEATRSKRIQQALEWLRQGKRRNWKYESKAAERQPD